MGGTPKVLLPLTILKDEDLTALDSDLQALNFFQDPHVILMCKQAGGTLIEIFL